MQFNIIPLDSGRLPAYLQNAPSELTDLTTGVGAGFGHLSIAGKSWTIINGAEKTMIMHPQAPDVPAQAIPMIIVKASPNLSRTFYVGDDMKESDIHASDKDGTLHLQMPKQEAKAQVEQAHRIAIEG